MTDYSFRKPASPPGVDATFYGRDLYDLAYCMLITAGGSHDYGPPIKFRRETDNGGVVVTTYCLEAAQGETSADRNQSK